MSLRAKCRWPFVLALFVAVQVTACSLVAGAWPGGGVGYPNTMQFDTWLGRTAAALVTTGTHGTGSKLTVAGVSNDLTLCGDGASCTGVNAGMAVGLAAVGRDNSGNAVFGTTGASDVTLGQISGTTKRVINLQTGDGAGVAAVRLSIDSDKVKVTTSPSTSTGVLVGADSGALDLKANAAGGGEIKLLSGGNLTIGASGSQFSTLLNGSGSLTPGSIAAGGQFTQGVTVTGVAVGDACFVGTPAAGGGPDITASCFASASGTATVKLQNGNSAAQTGTTGTYNCWCIH